MKHLVFLIWLLLTAILFLSVIGGVLIMAHKSTEPELDWFTIGKKLLEVKE